MSGVEAPTALSCPEQLALSARLTGLHEAGADPLRLRQAEALLRRLPALHGSLRIALAQRLSALLDGLPLRGERAERGACMSADAPELPGLAALRALVAELQTRASDSGALPGAGAETFSGVLDAYAGLADKGPEPGSLCHFRHASLRLRDEARLCEALADLPENPGPLNSQLLVHRALERMNALSPAYLGAFLAWADALVCLDAAQSGATSSRR